MNHKKSSFRAENGLLRSPSKKEIIEEDEEEQTANSIRVDDSVINEIKEATTKVTAKDFQKSNYKEDKDDEVKISKITPSPINENWDEPNNRRVVTNIYKSELLDKNNKIRNVTILDEVQHEKHHPGWLGIDHDDNAEKLAKLELTDDSEDFLDYFGNGDSA